MRDHELRSPRGECRSAWEDGQTGGAGTCFTWAWELSIGLPEVGAENPVAQVSRSHGGYRMPSQVDTLPGEAVGANLAPWVFLARSTAGLCRGAQRCGG